MEDQFYHLIDSYKPSNPDGSNRKYTGKEWDDLLSEILNSSQDSQQIENEYSKIMNFKPPTQEVDDTLSKSFESSQPEPGQRTMSAGTNDQNSEIDRRKREEMLGCNSSKQIHTDVDIVAIGVGEKKQEDFNYQDYNTQGAFPQIAQSVGKIAQPLDTQYQNPNIGGNGSNYALKSTLDSSSINGELQLVDKEFISGNYPGTNMMAATIHNQENQLQQLIETNMHLETIRDQGNRMVQSTVESIPSTSFDNKVHQVVRKKCAKKTKHFNAPVMHNKPKKLWQKEKSDNPNENKKIMRAKTQHDYREKKKNETLKLKKSNFQLRKKLKEARRMILSLESQLKKAESINEKLLEKNKTAIQVLKF